MIVLGVYLFAMVALVVRLSSRFASVAVEQRLQDVTAEYRLRAHCRGEFYRVGGHL